MKKELFDELKELMNQAIEHAEGKRNDLRETVFIDNARFIVSEEQWREVSNKIDAAPRNLPALRKLSNDSDVFGEK